MIIISSFFLLGCSSPTITDKDIVGTWIADDGAVFELKDDNTLIC